MSQANTIRSLLAIIGSDRRHWSFAGPHHAMLADALAGEGHPLCLLFRNQIAEDGTPNRYWSPIDSGRAASYHSWYAEGMNPLGLHEISGGLNGTDPYFDLHAVPSGFGGDHAQPLALFATPRGSRYHFSFELTPHDVHKVASAMPAHQASALEFAARCQWHGRNGFPSYDEIIRPSLPRDERGRHQESPTQMSRDGESPHRPEDFIARIVRTSSTGHRYHADHIPRRTEDGDWVWDSMRSGFSPNQEYLHLFDDIQPKYQPAFQAEYASDEARGVGQDFPVPRRIADLLNGDDPWATDQRPNEMTPEDYYMARGGNPVKMSSDAFQAWFGNSKVVDKRGQPLVAYHGSKSPFDAFDADPHGTLLDNLSGAGLSLSPSFEKQKEHSRRLGCAHWFTDSEDIAYGYADSPDGRVLPVHLSLQNPLDLRVGSIGIKELEQHLSVAYGHPARVDLTYSPELGAARAIAFDNSKIVDYARRMGHDGLIHDDTDITGRYTHTSYVAFHPSQIKHATENAGSYSRDNHNIRMSRQPVKLGLQEMYAWLEPSGRAHTFAGKTHERWIKEKGFPSMDDAFKQGWHRVTFSGKTLYTHNDHFGPNKEQRDYLESHAIDNRMERIVHSFGEEGKRARVLWGERHEFRRDGEPVKMATPRVTWRKPRGVKPKQGVWEMTPDEIADKREATGNKYLGRDEEYYGDAPREDWLTDSHFRGQDMPKGGRDDVSGSWVPIKSSWIIGIRRLKGLKNVIDFMTKQGKAYRYWNAPRGAFWRWLSATSKGRWWWANVRGHLSPASKLFSRESVRNAIRMSRGLEPIHMALDHKLMTHAAESDPHSPIWHFFADHLVANGFPALGRAIHEGEPLTGDAYYDRFGPEPPRAAGGVFGDEYGPMLYISMRHQPNASQHGLYVSIENQAQTRDGHPFREIFRHHVISPAHAKAVADEMAEYYKDDVSQFRQEQRSAFQNHSEQIGQHSAGTANR